MSKQLPLVAMDACCSPLAAERLSETQAVDLSALFKTLADPVRLRVLSRLPAVLVPAGMQVSV